MAMSARREESANEASSSDGSRNEVSLVPGASKKDGSMVPAEVLSREVVVVFMLWLLLLLMLVAAAPVEKNDDWLAKDELSGAPACKKV